MARRKSFRTIEPNRIQFIGDQLLVEKPKLQLFLFDPVKFTEIKDFSDFTSFHVADHKDEVIWINMHGIHDSKIVKELCDKFNIHKLAIEDILDTTQRPKVQEFDNFLYLSMNSVITAESNNFDLEHISFILGENYVLSFQEKVNDHFDHIRERIRRSLGASRERGPDYLLFILIEAMLDNYYQTIEKTELKIKSENYSDVNHILKPIDILKIESYKDILTKLKKSITPLKESLANLENTPSRFIENTHLKYYTDLKDHCLILLEELDNMLRHLESRVNLFFSYQSYRMNEIMKVLTIIGAIFIPLTFLAGIYGMNFKNMPELDKENAYFILLGVMFLIFIGMLLFFRKKKWF